MEPEEMKKWLRKLHKQSQDKGFDFRLPQEIEQAEKLGFVEVNRDIVDELDTMFACRVSPSGMAFAEISTQPKATEPQPAKSEKETKMERKDSLDQLETESMKEKNTRFQIETAAIPEVKRARGRKPGQCKYPFDALEVETNNSFFVADADEKQAIKTVSPSVAEANRRYSEEIPGETRVNRKGNVVPATRQLRKFIVRKVEGGARVFRVL